MIQRSRRFLFRTRHVYLGRHSLEFRLVAKQHMKERAFPFGIQQRAAIASSEQGTQVANSQRASWTASCRTGHAPSQEECRSYCDALFAWLISRTFLDNEQYFLSQQVNRQYFQPWFISQANRHQSAIQIQSSMEGKGNARSLVSYYKA